MPQDISHSKPNAPGRRPRPSNPFTVFDRTEIEQSIPSRFEKMAALYPSRLAVKSRRHELTYDALNRLSNRIARALLDRRGAGFEQVALLFDNGAPVIAAVLGTLKAGKAYVPLDRSHPAARTAFVLDDSGASVILTDAANRDLARSLPGAREVVSVDEISADASAANPPPAASPDAIACIYYTSGSTGRPKGVFDAHRNVLHNVMRYTNSLHICPEDRMTLIQPPAFSGAVSSMFGALANGAASLPFDVEQDDITSLASWLRDESATIYHSVPALFRQVASSGIDLPALRIIRLEGDQASLRDVESYRERFSAGCLLVNGLGATECGIVRQFFIDKETAIPGSSVPVGYETQDMAVALVDEAGNAVAPGEVGEIAVKSRYLAIGYWKRSDLTEASFPPDVEGGRRVYRTGDLGRDLGGGCLEYLGRRDFQMKVRGRRIDAAEIEAALLAIAGVAEAVVMTRADRGGEERLVAYLVAGKDVSLTATALRRALAAKLPEYMIPSAFVTLDAMPLNANRKIDRRALPAPGRSRPALEAPLVAPRTPFEQALAALWAEVLDIDEVGIHDAFLDLGGHSLSAFRILSLVNERFRAQVPIASFFQRPTVAGLAETVLGILAEAASPDGIAGVLAELDERPGGENRPTAQIGP